MISEQVSTKYAKEDRDNNLLSMESLIEKVALLSKNQDPYKVSKEIEEIKSIFYIRLNATKKEKEKNTEGESIKTEIDPLELKFKDIIHTYRKNKYEFRKNKEYEEKKNLKIKKQIIEEINKLSKEEESLKVTFEKFRSLQKRWRETGYVPITESNHIWQSYHHHIEIFYDFIKINNDLRDLDFKRNLEEKNEICRKANILLEEESINIAHTKLQELHEHWRNVGPVERSLREKTWEKFQEISKSINKKRNEYFVEKKNQDLKRLKKKNKISSEIIALISKDINSHYKWQEATKKCDELHLKWKSLGRLRKENNKDAWHNLREALKKFYDTKNTFYKQQKADNKKIIERQLTICKIAEKLKNSNDWEKTSRQLMKLQKEWKESKFRSGKKSQEIWERFKFASDTFFKAKKTHYKEIKKEEAYTYKEKKKIIKEIKEFKFSSDSNKDIQKLKKYRVEWEKLKNISKSKIYINDQFFNIINSKLSKLGIDKKTLALEQYISKVNLLKGDKQAIDNEKKIIKNKINMIQQEINQYETNISFFGKDKSTKLLLTKVQNNIKNAKSDLEELKQKIQLVNKTYNEV